jgi:hypothetical protein
MKKELVRIKQYMIKYKIVRLIILLTLSRALLKNNLMRLLEEIFKSVFYHLLLFTIHKRSTDGGVLKI